MDLVNLFPVRVPRGFIVCAEREPDLPVGRFQQRTEKRKLYVRVSALREMHFTLALRRDALEGSHRIVRGQRGRATSTISCNFGIGSDDQHRFGSVKWENASFILQKHCGLGCSLSQKSLILRPVKAGFLCVFRNARSIGIIDQVQDIAHSFVQNEFGHLVERHGMHEGGSSPFGFAWHFQVQAGEHRLGCTICAEPFLLAPRGVSGFPL